MRYLKDYPLLFQVAACYAMDQGGKADPEYQFPDCVGPFTLERVNNLLKRLTKDELTNVCIGEEKCVNVILYEIFEIDSDRQEVKDILQRMFDGDLHECRRYDDATHDNV